MTKIIHPYQLLEAPQVNILNNNIVEDVNYSYENSEIVLTTIKRFSYVGYKPVYDGEGNITSYRDVSESTYENTDIYDISVTEDTEDGMYYKRISFKFDCDSSSIVGLDSRGTNQGLEFNNASMSYYKYYKYWGGQSGWVYYKRSSDLENIDFSTIYARILGDVTSVVKNGDVYTIALSVVLIYDNVSSPSGNSDTNRAEHFLNEFSFDVQVKTISQTLTQIDTNSNLSIQSNELMQQDTKVNDTTQISEYIADNIKTHYADGKATISMQVVDDGTQEYDVHDIVEPRIARTEYRQSVIENPIVNSTDFFNNKSIASMYTLGEEMFVITRETSPYGCKIYSSNNGLDWVLRNEIAGFEFYRCKNINGKIFSDDASISPDGYNFYYLCSGNDIDDIAYYDGYYYFVGGSNSPVLQRISADTQYQDLLNHTTVYAESITTTGLPSDGKLYRCIVFKDKLFVIHNTGYTFTMYYSSNFADFTQTGRTSSDLGSFATNGEILMVTPGIYCTSDGINWTSAPSWGEKNVIYNEYMGAFILYNVSGGSRFAEISFDNASTFSNYSSVITYQGANDFYLTYNSNYIIYRTGTYNASKPFNAVKVLNWGYESVEYPLLTNEDNTPKEFEITSSELVYDGLTYYNLEAVEST